ncbi:MAG TPA: DegT/DnrJ/EryC1/StrS family aminotransferase [Terriglobales bacterium]|nr:DegT/DnrJ/EryC1/StrS family aminotransferase [Terriglobales bacterium]
MSAHSQLQTTVPATREALTVPFFDLRRQYRAIHDEIDSAIATVLEEGIFVGDPYVSRFEHQFAAYVGADYCVGVSSGTSALELTLRALEIGEGDEVIVPVNTFIATAEAVLGVRAIPVFAEISDTSYNVDPKDVIDRISSHTKAIIAVDLYGQPADLDALASIAASRGLVMIEDACQAHGARFGDRRVGSVSHATCFSFYPSKNLGAYGEGGAVTTNDGALADKVKLLRDHGSRTKYRHEALGYNHRLHALQAAVLSVKLAHLEDWIDARRRIAAQYDRLLGGSSVIIPRELPGRQHSYHLYVVRVAGRDAVQKSLASAGVSSGIHYPIPLHLQPVMASLHYAKGDFPKAEASASTILSLPIFPELRTYEAEYVAEQLIRSLACSE